MSAQEFVCEKCGRVGPALTTNTYQCGVTVGVNICCGRLIAISVPHLTVAEAMTEIRRKEAVLRGLDGKTGATWANGERPALRLCEAIDFVIATCRVNLDRPDQATGHQALETILRCLGEKREGRP